MNILNDIEDVLLDLDFIDPPRGYRNQKIEYKIFEDKVSIYGSRSLYFLKKDVNDIIDRIKGILVDNGYTVNIQNVDSDSHYMRYHDDEDAKWQTIVKGVNIYFQENTNESLRYLMLFESFKDDFYNSKRELDEKYEREKQDLNNNAKLVIDEFMYDLTDEYSNESDDMQSRICWFENGIEGDHLSITYYLKCDLKDLDRLLSTLSDVESRIYNELGFNLRVSAKGLKVDNLVFTNDLNHGFSSSLKELISYIEDIRGLKKGIPYNKFTFEIRIY